MTSDDTRNLFQQEDDGWSRAIELAVTPLVAGGIGYLLDRLFGTVPILTIICFAFAVVATFVKMYYAYDTKMKAHDAESPWGRAQAARLAREADRDATGAGDGRTSRRKAGS
jgi:F0F1-type ATP synthase assembly protein I